MSRRATHRYSVTTNTFVALNTEDEDDDDDVIIEDECLCHMPMLDWCFPYFHSSSHPNDYSSSSSNDKSSSHQNKKKSSLFGSPIPDTPNWKTNRENRRLNFLESMEQEKSIRNVNGLDTQRNDDVSSGSKSDLRLQSSSEELKQKQITVSPTGVFSGRGAERELNAKYKLLDILGVGSTSTCHRCQERSSRQFFACKVIDKQRMEQRFQGMLEQFSVEIEALRQLKHPNIIHLNDVYITPHKIYIIMELMEGGELFDYVVERGTLTELEASDLVRQVTSALEYMHSQGIVHRDLKPENLLLKTKSSSKNTIIPTVKIIDFGLSKCMHQPGAGSGDMKTMTRSFLGTRGYLAPEMLQRRAYNKSVDVWALGVIAFVLLCGCLPFDDDSGTIPSDVAIREKFILRYPRWASNLSQEAKDFLKHLLDIDPRTRYTAEKALQHAWLYDDSAAPTLSSTPSMKELRSLNVLESPRHMSASTIQAMNIPVKDPGIMAVLAAPPTANALPSIAATSTTEESSSSAIGQVNAKNNENGISTKDEQHIIAQRINVDELAKIRARANEITGVSDIPVVRLTREASI